MEEENISQVKMAATIGISQPQIHKYLKSTKYSYDLKGQSIERLFNALGYHPVINFTKVKTDKE